jgi:hypothetical protein
MLDNRDEAQKQVAGCEGDRCRVAFSACPICPSPGSCQRIEACAALYDPSKFLPEHSENE